MKKLIFVYNADSGIINAMFDTAHKLLSPNTYQCHLCTITYSHFGMRKTWKAFIKRLEIPLIFLHRDEFNQQYGLTEQDFPAIFKQQNQTLTSFISTKDINTCQTVHELMKLIENRLKT